MKITECGYCDFPLVPISFEGDLVCINCRAEWSDAKYERELTKEEIQEIECLI